MEVWAELEPSSRQEKLLKRASRIVAAGADVIDIPEAPLGVPRGYAAIIACMLKQRLGVSVVPHVRLLDVNLNAAVSIAKGLRACSVDRLVVLRGDPPAYGRPVDTKSEEAAALIKRLVDGVMVGALLSLRHEPRRVLERVRGSFDFFLVTRWLGRGELLELVSSEAHRAGRRLIGYLIVGCGSGLARLKEVLAGQPVVDPSEALRVVAGVRDVLDGVLVSSPGDVECLCRVVGEVRGTL